MRADSKRKLREAGRRGRMAQARRARRTRQAQVLTALAAGPLTVAEIADATGRSAGVVRAAIADLPQIVREGGRYRLQ